MRNSPRSPPGHRGRRGAQPGDIALRRLRVDVRRRALHCLAQIVLTGDVVAVEDGARLVPADLHRHALPDAGPHHVAHAAAPQVVEESGRYLAFAPIRVRPVDAVKAGFDARRRPRAAEVADRPTVPVKYELGHPIRPPVAPGNDASVGAALDDGAEVALDRDGAAAAVLRVLGSEPDHAAGTVDVRPCQRGELAERQLVAAPGESNAFLEELFELV